MKIKEQQDMDLKSRLVEIEYLEKRKKNLSNFLTVIKKEASQS